MHIDLKFMKSWGAYNAGEIARFAQEQAKAIIERGVAIEHEVVTAVEQLIDGQATQVKTEQEKSGSVQADQGNSDLDKSLPPADSASKGGKTKSG